MTKKFHHASIHPRTVIVGVQFGDEAKGKHTEWRGSVGDVGAVVRFNGGSNAGHTIVIGDQEYKLRLTPSGIFNPESYAVIGSGVMVNPVVLNQELEELTARGISIDNLRISKAATVVTPYEIALDQAEEALRKNPIGTTKSGNGPATADKYRRAAVRMLDLGNQSVLIEKLETMLQRDRALLEEAGVTFPEPDEVASEFQTYHQRFEPFLADTGKLLQDVADNGDGLLFEGAQGTFLDIEIGNHPYVTSSHCVADAAGLGGYGLPDKEVIGVVKAYISRVGGGLLLTELHDEKARFLQDKGHERGTVTNRPRRCGWLDLVLLRVAKRVNALAKLDVTKLDVLTDIPGGVLKVAVAYKHKETGEQITDQLPDYPDQYEPIYEELPAPRGDITACRSWDELPAEAQDYVAYISEAVDLPIDLIGVGPGHDQTIHVGQRLQRKVLT